MLEVKNLETSYGLIKALKGVTLTAKKGNLTCILGPNGAGKTTLLFTLSGILKATSGQIVFENKDLFNLNASLIVENGLALVPENRLVFPQLSVRENLLAGAYTRLRKHKEAVNNDIDDLFKRFPILKQRSSQMAGTMSGGEQQMLAVARALMSKPKMILMDEPSVGLAPMIVDDIFSIIKELNQEGISIILVEQNATKALEIGDYFYFLNQGKVSFHGEKSEMSKESIIKSAYLGQ